MTNRKEQKYSKTELVPRLESLHQSFLGICTLYSCNIPLKEYEINDKHFYFNQLETSKIIFGRLCIILFDNNHQSYDTISYKILIKNIQNSLNLDDVNKQSIKLFQKTIQSFEKKYKGYRDKIFAHIELKDNSLINLKDYGLSNQVITEMIDNIKRMDDFIFTVLHGGATDHMAHDIGNLSSKIWEAYEKVDLVKSSTS